MKEWSCSRTQRVWRRDGYHVSWTEMEGRRKRVPSSSSSSDTDAMSELARSTVEGAFDGEGRTLRALPSPLGFAATAKARCRWLSL